MNIKEKSLHSNIKKYSDSTANYYRLLGDILEKIERLEVLEKEIDKSYNDIMQFKDNVRPLNFIKDIENTPAINNTILNKVKSFLK